MLKQVKFLGIFLVTTMVLTACGSGIIGSKTAPDETRVVDGPSLSVPPDFELRPPQKGETYTVRSSRQKTKEAQNLITGGGKASNTVETGEDAWLLNQTGGRIDANIREELESEFDVKKEEDEKSFWDRQKENFFGKDDTENTEEK